MEKTNFRSLTELSLSIKAKLGGFPPLKISKSCHIIKTSPVKNYKNMQQINGKKAQKIYEDKNIATGEKSQAITPFHFFHQGNHGHQYPH